MILALARFDLVTKEIRGIVQFSNPNDMWNTVAVDTNSGYGTLDHDQFHRLQGSAGYGNENREGGLHHPPHHHRYEDGQPVVKVHVEIIVDKYYLEVGKDTANVTWSAPTPSCVAVNGVKSGPYNNTMPITASVAGTYVIELDDPQYCSNFVIINADEKIKK